MSPHGRRLLGDGVAASGFLLLGFVLMGRGIMGSGGVGGTDALAYWGGGRRLLEGLPLYGAAAGGTSAYLYSPLFAQVVAPLAILPPAAFVWLWRVLALFGLRITLGSWRRAGIAILIFPPVIIEVDYANVDLLLAAACALTMRSRAGLIGPSFAAKFAGLPLVPLAWVTDRRGLLLGAACTSGAVLVSVLIAPNLWAEYAAFLSAEREPTYWTNLGRGIPWVIRLVVAIAVGIAAIRYVRLAPLALLIGLPVVWLSALSLLVAVVTPLPRRRTDLPKNDALAQDSRGP